MGLDFLYILFDEEEDIALSHGIYFWFDLNIANVTISSFAGSPSLHIGHTLFMNAN